MRHGRRRDVSASRLWKLHEGKHVLAHTDFIIGEQLPLGGDSLAIDEGAGLRVHVSQVKAPALEGDDHVLLAGRGCVGLDVAVGIAAELVPAHELEGSRRTTAGSID